MVTPICFLQKKKLYCNFLKEFDFNILIITITATLPPLNIDELLFQIVIIISIGDNTMVEMMETTGTGRVI